MRVASELTSQPEKDNSPILVESRGEVVIGTPYQIGDAVAFDMVETIKRSTYAVREDDEKSVVRRQQRYMAARFTLRVDENGVWEFDSTFAVHSTPNAVGKPYLTGAVKWLDNGVELIGIGTDNAYAADGRTIRAAVHGRIRLTRNGEALSVDDIWQAYHLGTDPDGVVLPFPDFKRPIGKSGRWLSGEASAK